MFRDAKVGDRVWSVLYGWGIISDIDRRSSYPIKVAHEEYKEDQVGYEYSGKWRNEQHPALFWGEVKIIPPSKPKRKVKRVVEGWLNMCPDRGVQGLFNTKKEAELSTCRLGEPMFIRHEYEADED